MFTNYEHIFEFFFCRLRFVPNLFLQQLKLMQRQRTKPKQTHKPLDKSFLFCICRLIFISSSKQSFRQSTFYLSFHCCCRRRLQFFLRQAFAKKSWLGFFHS